MHTEILYATTDDGSTLAIIDVTHPAFAVVTTDAELADMAEQSLIQSQQMQHMPEAVREALQRSVLGRGLIAASGTFLSGLNTYMFKLGPNNLGPNPDPVDQRIAASYAAISMRLRLGDMARMLADSIAPIAKAAPHRPLCFINIAGGPAADTWNTLIHLQTEHPGLLANRNITITVLDLDTQGPSFGRRAINALSEPAAHLNGLNIHHQHLPYEWSQTHRLPQILTDLHASLHSSDAICAISSEGGLFEYGSDEQIIENLKKLHAGTPPDAIVVGSVTRESEVMRASNSATRIQIIPRSQEAFQNLATQSGWTVQHTIERPMSNDVRLLKA